MAVTGRNLTNGVIEISKGVYADDRLRIGGILYLEEKLDKTFEAIADEMSKFLDSDKLSISKMVRAIQPFIIALTLQRNPEMSEGEVEQILMRLEIDDFTSLFAKVKLFDREPKNEHRPTPRKKKVKAHQIPRKTG